MFNITHLIMDLEYHLVFQPMEDINWSYDELKKALLDSAADYDRIVRKMDKDNDRTKVETEEGETQSSSEE